VAFFFLFAREPEKIYYQASLDRLVGLYHRATVLNNVDADP
jgi:hypothetical protein